MASFAKYMRLVPGVLAFLLVVGASAPSNAQQINPTASSVKEQQLLQELNRIQGRVSIPDQRSGVLEQPAGRDWREFRNVTLRWIGGIAILGVIAVLVIFYLPVAWSGSRAAGPAAPSCASRRSSASCTG